MNPPTLAVTESDEIVSPPAPQGAGESPKAMTIPLGPPSPPKCMAPDAPNIPKVMFMFVSSVTVKTMAPMKSFDPDDGDIIGAVVAPIILNPFVKRSFQCLGYVVRVMMSFGSTLVFGGVFGFVFGLPFFLMFDTNRSISAWVSLYIVANVAMSWLRSPSSCVVAHLMN